MEECRKGTSKLAATTVKNGGHKGISRINKVPFKFYLLCLKQREHYVVFILVLVYPCYCGCFIEGVIYESFDF